MAQKMLHSPWVSCRQGDRDVSGVTVWARAASGLSSQVSRRALASSASTRTLSVRAGMWRGAPSRALWQPPHQGWLSQGLGVEMVWSWLDSEGLRTRGECPGCLPQTPGALRWPPGSEEGSASRGKKGTPCWAHAAPGSAPHAEQHGLSCLQLEGGGEGGGRPLFCAHLASEGGDGGLAIGPRPGCHWDVRGRASNAKASSDTIGTP